MYFLKTQNNFLYDHGINLATSTITLLAFLVTFGNIIYNIHKQSKEYESRNKKTLGLIDLMLESEISTAKKHLKQIKDIRTNDWIHKLHTHPLISETDFILDTKDPTKIDFYIVPMNHIELPTLGKTNVETKNKNIFIIALTYVYIYDNEITNFLKNYKESLKAYVKNQHLNLNSKSLDKITTRINNLNEIIEIINSINIENIVYLSGFDTTREQKIDLKFNEEEIQDIEAQIKNLKKLENKLNQVTKNMDTKDTKK